jgi:hypothetical protein
VLLYASAALPAVGLGLLGGLTRPHGWGPPNGFLQSISTLGWLAHGHSRTRSTATPAASQTAPYPVTKSAAPHATSPKSSPW